MQKKGATNPWIIVIGIAVVAYLLWGAGVFTPTEDGVDDEVPLPSDLKTTVTLSFKDELATTETTVNAKWYAFNGDGTFYDSGTAGSSTAGQDSFDANVQTAYDVVTYLDTAGGEYLPKTTRINTGTKPTKTVTIPLIASSDVIIQKMTNTVDLDSNMTCGAGATEEFRVIWNVNSSNSGTHPMILIDANSTTRVDDITTSKADSAGGTWAEVDCPDRAISALTYTLTDRQQICFERNKVAYTSDGNVLTYFSALFDSTNAPGAQSYIEAVVLDKFMYLEPGYSTIDGIIYAYEDAADADIGEADSAVSHVDCSD